MCHEHPAMPQNFRRIMLRQWGRFEITLFSWGKGGYFSMYNTFVYNTHFVQKLKWVNILAPFCIHVSLIRPMHFVTLWTCLWKQTGFDQFSAYAQAHITAHYENSALLNFQRRNLFYFFNTLESINLPHAKDIVSCPNYFCNRSTNVGVSNPGKQQFL